MAKIRRRLVARSLKSWESLNKMISTFNEEEVLLAMKLENDRGRVRMAHLRRLTQRLNGIKRDELIKELYRD